MRILLISVIAIGSSVAALAQPTPTGSIVDDFRVVDSVSSDVPAASRSPLLAGALSAVLPGAGQLYARAPWWRTLLYGAVEAGGWITFLTSDARGDDLTHDFESFADRHWSVVRYIEWIARNIDRWPEQDVDRAVARAALAAVYREAPAGASEWERIDLEALSRLERSVRRGFSHTLPPHGDQQYYEQVGKYVQYRAGWDDHATELDTVPYDPARVTERNREYMDLRARANDSYGVAAAALGVVVLNHVLSALDAVLTARAFNAHFSVEPSGAFVGGDARGWLLSLRMTF